MSSAARHEREDSRLTEDMSASPTLPNSPQSTIGGSRETGESSASSTSRQSRPRKGPVIIQRRDDIGTTDDGSNEKRSTTDRNSINSTWTESTIVPRRTLGVFHTASLMLNGVFAGPFFFSMPYYTLALVRSKRICFLLWAIGGIYSALGMTVFLEYGTALPYTGGALIYLNRVFHWPKLLATVIFSIWWIFTAATDASCKSIAQVILSLTTGQGAADLDVRLINFTAVAVQTIVCLLLFFARRATFTLNTLSATFRIVLCIVLFVAGIRASARPNSGWNDFNVEYPGYSGKDTLLAMINIVLLYQGWDNANYVTGEVKDAKETLKRAGIATISILNIFYLLMLLAFFSVAPYEVLTSPKGQASTAELFATIVFGETTGMQVAVLLSSLGTLIFITYTTARVKQAIAWQGIIPFSKLFGRQDPYYDSPGGGLFLHWLFTVILIPCTGNFSSDSLQFWLGIYAYGYQIMIIFLALGLFRLTSQMNRFEDNWKPTYLKNKFVLAAVASVYIAINIVTLVMTALSSPSGAVPRFYWPVCILAIVAFAIGYWAVLRSLQVNKKRGYDMGSKLGLKLYVYEDQSEIPEEMKFPMREAELDGSGRRLVYELSGSFESCSKVIAKVKAAFTRIMDF